MRILAIDYGDARTGLAYCDQSEMIASPLETVAERNREKLLLRISQKAEELGTELIVVGLPKNMDGSLGERAEKCREFAVQITEKTGIETVMWDERITTVQAISILNGTNVRGKKRKAVIDTVAATLILESYLDYRKKKCEAAEDNRQ